MNELSMYSRAIDKSKGFYGRVQGEPLVPTDRVLLREVVHSLEILWGYTEHELTNSSDPKSPQALNDALCDGELVARVYRDDLEPQLCPIIPAIAWRRINPEQGENAFNSGFWMYAIRYDQDCDGFGGELPFIIRTEAEEWLAQRSDGNSAPDLKSRITRLFEEARGSTPLSPSDPPVPRNFVTIYDIAYALERLKGLAIDRLVTGHTPEVYELLLSALIDQQLIARMLENDVVVPKVEWESFRHKGGTAFESGFVSGGLEFVLHDDPKLRGMTAVVPAEAATEWLAELHSQKTETTESAARFSTEDELLVWYRDIYLPSFDTKKRLLSAEKENAIMARDGVGHGVKRERARRIRAQCDPPEARLPGRRSGQEA